MDRDTHIYKVYSFYTTDYQTHKNKGHSDNQDDGMKNPDNKPKFMLGLEPRIGQLIVNQPNVV